MLYELSGKVKKVCEVETFASGFTKRSLIVSEVNDKTKYPAVWCIDFTKDKTAFLDGIRPGSTVTVKFSVGGREWTDPKTNRVRYFTSLTGFGVKVSGEVSKTPAPAVPPPNIDDVLGDDGMPF